MSRRFWLVVGLASWLGCRDAGPRPVPGTLIATLASPSGAEGAAVVSLFGDGIGEIQGVGDTEVYREDGGGVTRLVLVNQAGGELAFEISLADVAFPPQAAVLEVAGPDDALRPQTSAYLLEFTP